MRRRLWLAVLLSVGVGVALSWVLAPALVRRLVFTAPVTDRQQPSQLADVDALRQRVQAALPSLGLRDEQRAEHTAVEQQDGNGSWTTIQEVWSLSSEADALAMAQRLEALVASSDDKAEIYVLEQGSREVQLRFYAGPRLALVMDLQPNLGPWPTLANGQAPMLALVVYGIDADPHGVHQLMELGAPLALALSPYSPFTLRLSRDALLTHTEVLAIAETDVSLAESLESVPHASGVLLTATPAGDPDKQVQALRRADVYLLDAVEGGLGAHWLRALQDAGVPYLRATTPVDELDRRRYRHAAAHDGAAVVVIPASQGKDEAAALQAAAGRGYRLSFPAEVVEALRE